MSTQHTFKDDELRATVQIGKNGITEQLVNEIKKQLKKRKLIKIKILKSYHKTHDRKETAKKLCVLTKARLLSQKGFVIVLRK
ncbi:RNA-binding protein [Candidatus Woesearchaeota archaeon]|nr:MAG: RNA-binding protein [Candidatus Woesearchaeota archaeon]